MDNLNEFLSVMGGFSEMLDDWELTPEDYYDKFSKMCINYSSTSNMPYSICNTLIEDEFPCEKYYMQMLMDVYSYYNVGDNFLELLQKLIDEGYCDESKKEAQDKIKEHINDGCVIAYRGEFATEEHNNLDYTESVSYSLDYEQAKFFATRYKMLQLTKSVVYTVKVPIDDILAYIERENEVVCLPVCIGGKMEVIKEDSFL